MIQPSVVNNLKSCAKWMSRMLKHARIQHGQRYKPKQPNLDAHLTACPWHQKHLAKQNPTPITTESQAARIFEVMLSYFSPR